jgi:hypothetical protein
VRCVTRQKKAQFFSCLGEQSNRELENSSGSTLGAARRISPPVVDIPSSSPVPDSRFQFHALCTAFGQSAHAHPPKRVACLNCELPGWRSCYVGPVEIRSTRNVRAVVCHASAGEYGHAASVRIILASLPAVHTATDRSASFAPALVSTLAAVSPVYWISLEPILTQSMFRREAGTDQVCVIEQVISVNQEVEP